MAPTLDVSEPVWPPPERVVRPFSPPTNTDALISIFQHLDSHSMNAVSKTCSFWRIVALDTPTLWCDLTLSGSAGLGFFYLVLQRSGEAPVHMDLFCDSGDCVEAALEVVYECRLRLVALTIRLADTFDFTREYRPGQWAPLVDSFKHSGGIPLLRHFGIHIPLNVDHGDIYRSYRTTQPGDIAELRALQYLATADTAPRLRTLELSGIPVELRALSTMAGVTTCCVQLDEVAVTDIHTLFDLFPALRVLKLVTLNMNALAHLTTDDADMLSALEELHLFPRIYPRGYIYGLELLHTAAYLQRVRCIVLHGLDGMGDEVQKAIEVLDCPVHVAVVPAASDVRSGPMVMGNATVRVETASGFQRSFVVAKQHIWSLARPAMSFESCTLLTMHNACWTLAFGENTEAIMRGLLRGIRTLRILLSPRTSLPNVTPYSPRAQLAAKMPELARLELRADPPGTVVRVSTDELRRFLHLFDGMDELEDPFLYGVLVYPGRVPAHDLLRFSQAVVD